MDYVNRISFSTTKLEKEGKKDDGELPSGSECIDKQPEEAEQVHIFSSSAK